MLRTHDHARGFQSNLGPMRTVVTLGGSPSLWIDINGVIRARLHTSLASDAKVGVEIYDPVFALVHRRHGTDGHARRLLAMVAACHLEDASRVRELSSFYILNPGTINA